MSSDAHCPTTARGYADLVSRPTSDVVVPFWGEATQLEGLRERLGQIKLGSGDSVVVVDNTPGRTTAPEGPVAVLHASEREAPGYARGRGAARGTADWIVFIDADVEPPADLLDRYFDPSPDEHTGMLAGGIIDEPVPRNGPAAARYAYIRRFMSQDDTMGPGPWGFPKTANVACRRTAFEELGGFRQDIRGGEDADLTYRLRASGWQIERRERAAVVHRNRETVRAFVVQKLKHGSGMGWVNREYPGASPPRRLPGLTWWGVRTAARRLVRAARTRNRDDVLWALFEPLELVIHEVGRALPNRRPLRRLRPLGPSRRAGVEGDPR